MRFPRTVYLIRHNRTGRIYIGSSVDPSRRFKKHIEDLRKGVHPVEDMQADFDKCGEDYAVEFLEVISAFEDRHHEYEWQDKFNSITRGVGYNYKDFANRKRSRVRTQKGKLFKLIKSLTDEEAEKFVAFLEANGGKL